MSMAARQHGMRCDELHGVESPRAHSTVGRLVRAGILFRARLSTHNVRYFTREFDRDAYLVANPPAPKVVKPAMPAERPQKALTIKAPPAVAMRATWDTDTPADYSRALRTACPSMPGPRFKTFDLPGITGLQRGRVS